MARGTSIIRIAADFFGSVVRKGEHFLPRLENRSCSPVAALGFMVAFSATALCATPQAQAATEGTGPIQIGGCTTITQSGSYVVTNNLSSGSDDDACLNVVADHVTIDLAGFHLNCRGLGDGIKSSPGGDLEGLVVRNGTISNCEAAVWFMSATGAVVEGIRAHNNEAGIWVTEGSIVTGNAVSDSGTFGIFAHAGTIISENYVFGSGASGILVLCPSVVTGNTAVSNNTDGFENFSNLDAGENCSLSDNVAP